MTGGKPFHHHCILHRTVMAAVVLSHIVNRTTLSRGIFKSPAVWLVASCVTLSCDLSQNSKMLQEKLNYCIPATTVRMNTVRIHTCYSNTDMFLKRHANKTVGFSPKRKVSSKPLIFFTAVRPHLLRLGAAGE